MESKGIRILDNENGYVTVKLEDVLEEIDDVNKFNWSIFYLYTIADLGSEKSVQEFEDEIRKSKTGYFISWEELNILSQKFLDLWDISLIGCRDAILLKRYESDQEMYETCDIVIEKLDSSYWEVFSKDKQLIERLALKFKEIEFLEPDFEK